MSLQGWRERVDCASPEAEAAGEALTNGALLGIVHHWAGVERPAHPVYGEDSSGWHVPVASPADFIDQSSNFAGAGAFPAVLPPIGLDAAEQLAADAERLASHAGASTSARAGAQGFPSLGSVLGMLYQCLGSPVCVTLCVKVSDEGLANCARLFALSSAARQLFCCLMLQMHC